MLLPTSPDAVRTAEQLRAQFNERPVRLLISDGDDQTDGGDLIIGLSKALACSESTNTLILDFGTESKALARCLADAAMNRSEHADHTENATDIDSDVHYVRVEPLGSEKVLPASALTKIEDSHESYDWIVVRGSPLDEEGSYRIMSRVDKTIALFAKDKSSLSNVQEIERKHRSITQQNLAVLLVSD